MQVALLPQVVPNSSEKITLVGEAEVDSLVAPDSSEPNAKQSKFARLLTAEIPPWKYYLGAGIVVTILWLCTRSGSSQDANHPEHSAVREFIRTLIH